MCLQKCVQDAIFLLNTMWCDAIDYIIHYFMLLNIHVFHSFSQTIHFVVHDQAEFHDDVIK